MQYHRNRYADALSVKQFKYKVKCCNTGLGDMHVVRKFIQFD